MTAHSYLVEAISSVNDLMGEGAAEKYPQIVAALVTAAAQDYHTGKLCEAIAISPDMGADMGAE